MPAEKHQWNVRVYYEDTDSGGVVYYANYLRFFERARTEWLRHKGIELDDFGQQYGLVFAVRHADIDFIKAAKFNDLLTVESDIARWGKASITFAQQIYSVDKSAPKDEQQLICRARIKVACVSIAHFKVTPIPQEIIQKTGGGEA